MKGDGSVWAEAPDAFGDEGKEIVRRKSHKYLSPAFYFIPDETGETDGVIREFAALSLVTRPNFVDMPAINSVKAETSAPNPKKESTMDPKELRLALGLAEDASEDEVKAKVAALSESAKPKVETPVATNDNTALLAKIGEMIDSKIAPLQKGAAESHAQIATNAVDGYIKAGKLPPHTRDYWLKKCETSEGLKESCEYLDTLPVLVSTNSRNLNPDVKPGELSDEQKEICAKAGFDPEKFKNTKPTWLRHKS